MPSPAKSLRTPRSDNRLGELLDAAARLFASRGYAATSMRDIAREIQMLPGSVYYHFPSKDELLFAVYAAGVQALNAACTAALERETDPWRRLEALCRAHLETVLQNSDYAQVLIRVVPDDIPRMADQLRDLRASHECFFRDAVRDLPLPDGADRRALRLMLMGAMNWAPFWFNPQGRDTPRWLARKFIGLIKETQDDQQTTT